MITLWCVTPCSLLHKCHTVDNRGGNVLSTSYSCVRLLPCKPVLNPGLSLAVRSTVQADVNDQSVKLCVDCCEHQNAR